MKIGVIDYGSGNIGSVQNAIKMLGHEVILSSEFKELEACSHLILPGVGKVVTIDAHRHLAALYVNSLVT